MEVKKQYVLSEEERDDLLSLMQCWTYISAHRDYLKYDRGLSDILTPITDIVKNMKCLDSEIVKQNDIFENTNCDEDKVSGEMMSELIDGSGFKVRDIASVLNIGSTNITNWERKGCNFKRYNAAKAAINVLKFKKTGMAESKNKAKDQRRIFPNGLSLTSIVEKMEKNSKS